MADQKARDLWAARNTVELFKYLNGMWFKIILETLEDLGTVKPFPFISNPGQYQPELRAAGIAVERMEVAMAAALHKAGQSVTLEKFEELYSDKLTTLPLQSRREVKEFWDAGPVKGEHGDKAPPPTIGATGDWFVTGFSGTSVSVVVTIGINYFDGTITFENANGTKINKSILLVGPSLGVSVTPNLGKAASKIPGAEGLLKKFPAAGRLLKAGEEAFAGDVVSALAKQAPKLAAALQSSPKVKKLAEFLIKNRTAGSAGAESWPSAAIGLTTAGGQGPLTATDFDGTCLAVSFTGAAGPANFGMYALFFGVYKDWRVLNASHWVFSEDPANISRGMALISSASLSAGLPSLDGAVNGSWGEIK